MTNRIKTGRESTYYEYHYSPHKLAFQNIMRAGDQKLMINLEWPYHVTMVGVQKKYYGDFLFC